VKGQGEVMLKFLKKKEKKEKKKKRTTLQPSHTPFASLM
jgi:hypothetical protein